MLSQGVDPVARSALASSFNETQGPLCKVELMSWLSRSITGTSKIPRIVMTRRLYKSGMFVINDVLLSLTGAVANDITSAFLYWRIW